MLRSHCVYRIGTDTIKLSSNIIHALYRLTRITYDGYFRIFNISGKNIYGCKCPLVTYASLDDFIETVEVRAITTMTPQLCCAYMSGVTCMFVFVKPIWYRLKPTSYDFLKIAIFTSHMSNLRWWRFSHKFDRSLGRLYVIYRCLYTKM